MRRLAIIAALVAATPGVAQAPPGYSFGKGPAGSFWQQCNPDGFFGRVGDPPSVATFWFQTPLDAGPPEAHKPSGAVPRDAPK
jgi:hypothetical protein